MDRARHDVRRCAPEGVRRLAVVFGVPYLSKTRKHDVRQIVERLIDYGSKIDTHAFAWVFPALKRYPEDDDRFLHPGVMIWIREVKR